MKARIFFSMLSAGILMLTAGSARADFITDHAAVPVLENQIHDSSLEFATGLDATGHLQVGSVISGVVLYTQIGQTGNLNGIPGLGGFTGEVTAVFSLKITSIITGVPVVGNILTFGSSGALDNFSAGAMAVLFENDSAKPLTAAIAAGGGTIPSYIAAAEAGTVNLVVGFAGTSAGEGWTGTATNLAVPPTTGLTGSYNGNVDLLPFAYAPGTLGALGSSPPTDGGILFNEPNPNGLGNTQFALRGTQSFNPNFPSKSPFPVSDDSSIFYFVGSTIPEPASMMLLGIGSVALAGFGIRRKLAKN